MRRFHQRMHRENSIPPRRADWRRAKWKDRRPLDVRLHVTMRRHAAPWSKTWDWAAQSLLTPAPGPCTCANSATDTSQGHVATPKLSPSLPTVDNRPGLPGLSVAKLSSPSPLPLQSYLAVNWSESASPPSQGVSAIQPKQRPPFGRIHMPRKGRGPGAMSSPALPVDDVSMLPHEQALARKLGQDAQKRVGGGEGGQSSRAHGDRRIDGPASQTRGGHR